MSNLSLISGAGNAEASQIIPIVNTLIQNVNAGTAGLLAASLTTGATGANTTATDLQSFTLPAAFLTATRPGLRVRAWGATGATANNKTVTINFGATAYTLFSASALNNVTWSATLEVWRTGDATQRIFGTGYQGTTNVAMGYTAGTDNTLTTAQVIRVIGTNGTAAANDILCYGMVVEVIQ